MAGFDADQTEALVTAATEASANVIRRDDDAPGDCLLGLSGDIGPTALTLEIIDHGLPFEPTDGDDAIGPGDGEGCALDWSLVHAATDEVRWTNLGKAGMQLRIVKYRPQSDVTEQMPAADLTPFHDAAPLAPEQAYTVRRMRPDEAIAVSQCIYRAYGYSYPNEDVYFPDRIVHLNETGELASIVAVGESGEIVGHYALERPGLGPVAESGQVVVNPAHRGRKIMERMRVFLEEEAERIGLKGVYGLAVTAHVFSQRSDEAFGCKVCGVWLGCAPRTVNFKKIVGEPLPQRGSCMLYYKPIAQVGASPVHLPPQHRAMLERIYAHLDAPVELHDPSAGHAARLPRSSIRVDEVGSDTAAEVRRALADLVTMSAAEVVYLQLPLAQEGTVHLCTAAEKDGFFFCALGPSFANDGDALVLQYLNAPLDPSLLQIASPFGVEIRDYAAAERARVGSYSANRG
ncbi:MAG: N-acetyltransferase protein [Chloroflexi bacterium]|nr:N-acetyltransferase protein [Chloroflexota bacterium]